MLAILTQEDNPNSGPYLHLCLSALFTSRGINRVFDDVLNACNRKCWDDVEDHFTVFLFQSEGGLWGWFFMVGADQRCVLAAASAEECM